MSEYELDRCREALHSTMQALEELPIPEDWTHPSVPADGDFVSIAVAWAKVQAENAHKFKQDLKTVLSQRDAWEQRTERAEELHRQARDKADLARQAMQSYKAAHWASWSTLARVRKLRDTWSQATQLGQDYEGQLADVVRHLTEALEGETHASS